jgi:hypothetical protein
MGFNFSFGFGHKFNSSCRKFYLRHGICSYFQMNGYDDFAPPRLATIYDQSRLKLPLLSRSALRP